MNRQEMLNTAYMKLKQQGSLCYNSEGQCAYRSGEMRCAFGWLIPDDMYRDEMEGLLATSVITEHPELQKHFGVKDIHDMEFFEDLQAFLHDRLDVGEYNSLFQTNLDKAAAIMANKYGLINPAITPPKEVQT